MSNSHSIGVMCSLAPEPQKALEAVAELGLTSVQTGYPEALDNPEGITAIQQASENTGIKITTVFCGFPGESYADIPTVRATVGLVPQGTRDKRVEIVHRIARFARSLGVKRVAAHIGFIPEDHEDINYRSVVACVREICDYLGGLGLDFALETGQETAKTLHQFILDVEEEGKRGNLKVNFDPANMILYGNDNPISATKLLAPWIDGVHAKDGNWPEQEGKLGHETPLGEGEVEIRLWIKTLLELGYEGPITIEREISGDQQRKDIMRGKALLEDCLRQS